MNVAMSNGMLVEDAIMFLGSILNENSNDFGIEIFPNPVIDRASIKINFALEVGAELKIMVISGRLVYSQSLEPKQGNKYYEINKPDISPGIYTITLNNGGTTYTNKVVFE